ncbi:Hypothetical protein LUCI_4282 [Lucifera butyrica]|uniref:Uncharacterized protein n=1 Tax=Lucifera butyrica TaxID=1351585 RepID=A0A498R8H1_9FIRM|nr:hypothetical protein [Lucifera butyrica]VBB08996.1 Hypothetical protein LUCI_4282 [Lucifera butyrica]
MQALLAVKAVIEKELAEFPGKFCDVFNDDSYVRLCREEEKLKKLLAMTNQFIEEQAELEQHLEAYV